MTDIQYSFKKKMMAWILSICLVVTLIPEFAFAVTGDNSNERISPEEVTMTDIVEKTEDITTYDLGGGEKMSVFHGGQVRFEDDKGKLVDYDPSLETIETGETSLQDEPLQGYSYTNKAGDKKHYLPVRMSENTPVRMEYQDYAIEFSLTNESINRLSVNNKVAKKEEATIQTAYDDNAELPVNAVYGDEDGEAQVTYTSTEDSVKETLILNEKPETNVFQYKLNLTGMFARKNVTDGAVTYYDNETEEITGFIAAPWMNDATGDAYSEDITYELEEVEGKDGEYLLTMTIDEDYLNDPARQYPVTIDPTNTWQGSSEVKDVYVISGSTYGGTNFYESGTKKMPSGKNSTGTHRTYIKFIDLKTVTSGKSISSAKFTAYQSPDCVGSQKIGIYRITESWSISSLTYNNRPTCTTCYDTITTSSTDYAAKTWDVKTFVKNVASGSITNYGLQLYNKTSSPSFGCFVGSRASSYKPKLVVTYYDKPTALTSANLNKYDGSEYKKLNHFREKETAYVSWSGITSSILSQVQYKIIGYDSTQPSPTSVGDSGIDLTAYRSIGKAAASATNKSVPYSDELPEGKYKLYLRGKDTNGYVGGAKYVTLYKDFTKPTLTDVKADVTTSQIAPTKTLTPTISWNASDTYLSEVKIKVDSGEEVNVATVSGAGSYTIPSGTITSTGTHTITVTAYDKAGNYVSNTLDYYVDLTAPSIKEFKANIETTEANPTNETMPTITWTVEESALSSIDVYVNDVKVTSSQNAVSGYTLPYGTIDENGIYVIKLMAVDSTGNSAVKSFNYYVDVEKPIFNEISINPDTTLLSPTAVKSPKLTWEIGEERLEKVVYSMDQQSWTQIGTECHGSFMVPTSAFAAGNGNYTIYVKAIDKAGNESEIKEFTYRLNNTGNYEVNDLSAKEYYGKRVLTWTLDAFDGDTFAYDVYRSTQQNFTISEDNLIAEDIKAEELIYMDNELIEEGTYYYKIKARYRDEELGAADENEYISDEVSVVNTISAENLTNTLGAKEYLSYTSVELSIGTAQIEESSGNLFYQQEDFNISNSQLDYSLIRTYNSKNPIASMFGQGWSDSYHKEIYERGDDIYFVDSDGSTHIFEDADNDGIYTCIETPEFELDVTDTGYQITSKDETVYIFNTFGQLIKITEPNGCAIVNTYDDLGRLSVVTSNNTKHLEFVYNDESGKVSYVKDFVDTKYSYEYSGELLTKVKIDGSGLFTGAVSYDYGYSTDGMLDVITDGESNDYSFSYSQGKVVEAVYPDGESLSFSYSSGETAITKKTPSNITVFTETTVYDTATGKIASHTDPKGDITEYSYENQQYPYFATKIKSKIGYETIVDGEIVIHSSTNTVTNQYDGDGNLDKESDTEGNITDYEYENDLLVSETIFKDGETIEDTRYQYDDDGNLEGIYEAVQDTLTVSEYDENGNEILSIEKEDVIISSEDIENIDITNADIDGNVISETVTGYIEENPVSVDTEYASKDHTGTNSISESTNITYDAMGREIRTETNGIITETQYDFLGRVVKTVNKEAVLDENSAVKEEVIKETTVNTYNDNGALASESISDGITKEYTYDNRNRNIKEITSGTGLTTREKGTSYGYEENTIINEGKGTRTENIAYTQTTTDTAGNIVGKTYIDVAGNTIKEVAGDSFIDYTYDKSGNAVVTVNGNTGSDETIVTLQLYDEAGNNTATVSQPDISNNKYSIGSNSIVTRSTYDEQGNIITQTDGEGIVTKYKYDAENRITECRIGENAGDASTVTDLAVSYSVNEDTGITTTTVTDANGNIKKETNNAAGLTTSVSDIGGSLTITSNYEYDSLGRMVKESYGGGAYIIYSYENKSERISERKAYQGSTLENTVSYVYDNKERVISVTCLDAAGNEYSKTEYGYDAEGKVIAESVTYDAGTKNSIEYSYDSEGRLISKTYPSSTDLGTINYEYDIYGKCIKVLSGTDVIREYSYDSLERVSKIKDHKEPGSAAFFETTYTYDDHSRVSSMVTKDEGQAVLESFAYTYDNNDQIISYTHVNNLPEAGKKIDETRVYTYDDHGNLTRSVKTYNDESGMQSETTYTYDNVGNRLTMQVGDALTEYEYNGLNQLVAMSIGDTSTEYTYDDRGNQIREETTVSADTGEEESEVSTVTTDMEYSVTGQMISLTKASDGTNTFIQSNVYNHDGIRIGRIENGAKREYYYDGGIVAFTKDGNDISSANVLSPEGAAIGTYRDSNYYTYLNDIQGSTTNLVKADGSLAAAYDYTDFGETTEITENDFDNQICYTGGIYDKETELYYLNARYYNPATGRFISQDTYRGEMNDPGQWHLYVYCANNPINYVDPSGHKSKRYGKSWNTKEYLGWGITVQIARGQYITSASVGISMVWLNDNVDWYDNKALHSYWYAAGGLSSDFKDKVKATIKNNSGKLYSLSGLKDIRTQMKKITKKSITVSAQYFRVYGRKSEDHSFKDLKGYSYNINFTRKHFDTSIGVSRNCSAVGGGISTGKFGAGASVAYYSHNDNIRKFFKNTFSLSKVKTKAKSYL